MLLVFGHQPFLTQLGVILPSPAESQAIRENPACCTDSQDVVSLARLENIILVVLQRRAESQRLIGRTRARFTILEQLGEIFVAQDRLPISCSRSYRSQLTQRRCDRTNELSSFGAIAPEDMDLVQVAHFRQRVAKRCHAQSKGWDPVCGGPASVRLVERRAFFAELPALGRLLDPSSSA